MAMQKIETLKQAKDFANRNLDKGGALFLKLGDEYIQNLINDAISVGMSVRTAINRVFEELLKTKDGPAPAKKTRTKKAKDPNALTPKQENFMAFIANVVDEYKNPVPVGAMVDVLEPEGMSGMTVGAMVSTLREKGVLVTVREKYNGKTQCIFYLTEKGLALMDMLSQRAAH